MSIMHIYAELALIVLGVFTGFLVGRVTGVDAERGEWLQAAKDSQLHEHAVMKQRWRNDRITPV